MGITHAYLVMVDIYLFDSFFTCHRGETNTLMCVYKHGSSTSPCSSLSRMAEIYGWLKKPDQYLDFHTKQATSLGYPSRSQWKLQYINKQIHIYIYICSIYYMCICIGFTPPPCHSVDFQNGTKIGKPPGAAYLESISSEDHIGPCPCTPIFDSLRKKFLCLSWFSCVYIRIYIYILYIYIYICMLLYIHISL